MSIIRTGNRFRRRSTLAPRMVHCYGCVWGGQKSEARSPRLGIVSVDVAMAIGTECDQIFVSIITQSASRANVVDLKTIRTATVLASPTVTRQHFDTEFAIASSASAVCVKRQHKLPTSIASRGQYYLYSNRAATCSRWRTLFLRNELFYVSCIQLVGIFWEVILTRSNTRTAAVG
jgi:hypothetical protein